MSGQTEPSWAVIVPPKVERAIARLPRPEREHLLQAVRQLTRGPFGPHVKRLAGRPEWRLRVGNRRVLFRVDEQARVVVVTRIGPRGDVYK